MHGIRPAAAHLTPGIQVEGYGTHRCFQRLLGITPGLQRQHALVVLRDELLALVIPASTAGAMLEEGGAGWQGGWSG